MHISSGMQRNYPLVSRKIYELMWNVASKPDVWKAFKKYAELSDAQARAALMTCSATPIIDYKEMPGSNGKFNGKVDADRVYISKKICDKYETSRADRDDPRMLVLIESTILHELVHWGDHRDGKDQEGEEGKAFEREAYGRDIGTYW